MVRSPNCDGREFHPGIVIIIGDPVVHVDRLVQIDFILVPERYDPEEIKALKVGDGIFTEGREIEIRSITDRDGYMRRLT